MQKSSHDVSIEQCPTAWRVGDDCFFASCVCGYTGTRFIVNASGGRGREACIKSANDEGRAHLALAEAHMVRVEHLTPSRNFGVEAYKGICSCGEMEGVRHSTGSLLSQRQAACQKAEADTIAHLISVGLVPQNAVKALQE